MIPRDRLVLGTAKLGLPGYGYNSPSRPTAHEAIAIIRHAWRNGIKLFDTALGYGDATELLSQVDLDRTRGWVEPSMWIIKARLPLRVRKPFRYQHVLIHNPTVEDMRGLRQYGERAWPLGASVYTPEEVAEAKRLDFAPIQAPASCLNPAVEVEYGRAPFLQGVLLRNPNLAPPGLARAVFDFQQLCEDAGVGFKTLALHAAYGERIVFGVSSVEQLDQVLASCDNPTPPADLIAAARALASTVDATAALPSLWSK
jgi:aryl-alcohol dehydrogenase-like predicted oxidoreductase